VKDLLTETTRRPQRQIVRMPTPAASNRAGPGGQARRSTRSGWQSVLPWVNCLSDRRVSPKRRVTLAKVDNGVCHKVDNKGTKVTRTWST
jgi:hypothetical protein